MPMTLGKRGEALIKSFESLRLTSYLPTPNDVWTIGWGHTNGVHQGMTITENVAQRYFNEDKRFVEKYVQQCGDNLTQSMFDALCSLAFNVGPESISGRSTIGREVRAGHWVLAWRGFALWTRQGDKQLYGLARRRSQEMVLFFEDGLPK